MSKVTYTHDDGTTQDFNDQAYTDAAVAAAVAAITPAPVVAPEDTEIDIVRSDGSVKKFTLVA